MKRLQWRGKPLDRGEYMLVSDDRRFTIIEGAQHFTLLDRGAAVARVISVDKAKLAAEGRRNGDSRGCR